MINSNYEDENIKQSDVSLRAFAPPPKDILIYKTSAKTGSARWEPKWDMQARLS